MRLEEFTDDGDIVYINPLHVVHLSFYQNKTCILTSCGKYMNVDQDIKTVRNKIEYEPG